MQPDNKCNNDGSDDDYCDYCGYTDEYCDCDTDSNWINLSQSNTDTVFFE